MSVLDPEDAVSHIVEGIESVIAEAGVEPASILGVGVAVPGLVEHRGDAVVHGQSVGWHAVPLEAMLRDRTDLPILVDNGAKTLGQAERWFGAARGTDNAVIVLLGTGVGTCIVSNGEVYRGATSSAGEWGHTTIEYGGRLCRCGARGCLEAYVGAEAILDRYRQARRGRPVPGDDEAAQLTALVEAAPRSATAARVLQETAGYLGAGVANLVNLFNPERIVLGGWAGVALGGVLLDEIRANAARYALDHPYRQTSIELGMLDADAVAFSAATLPLAALLEHGGDPRERRQLRSRRAARQAAAA